MLSQEYTDVEETEKVKAITKEYGKSYGERSTWFSHDNQCVHSNQTAELKGVRSSITRHPGNPEGWAGGRHVPRPERTSEVEIFFWVEILFRKASPYWLSSPELLSWPLPNSMSEWFHFPPANSGAGLSFFSFFRNLVQSFVNSPLLGSLPLKKVPIY